MMIKVGKSYTGNKPQLQFEVDGFEKPLTYTKDDAGQLAKILDKVRKGDGSAFTAADLTDGRKFGGAWSVNWAKNEKDGKTYTNVMSIEPAA
ncbi:MAG TPA: hypothetical protein VGQ71_13215 [Terriglobales bacterium]|jgi:hypothetical protein|nr:hypothetical protein [Terriglobales bacterium]